MQSRHTKYEWSLCILQQKKYRAIKYKEYARLANISLYTSIFTKFRGSEKSDKIHEKTTHYFGFIEGNRFGRLIRLISLFNHPYIIIAWMLGLITCRAVFVLIVNGRLIFQGNVLWSAEKTFRFCKEISEIVTVKLYNVE